MVVTAHVLSFSIAHDVAQGWLDKLLLQVFWENDLKTWQKNRDKCEVLVQQNVFHKWSIVEYDIKNKKKPTILLSFQVYSDMKIFEAGLLSTNDTHFVFASMQMCEKVNTILKSGGERADWPSRIALCYKHSFIFLNGVLQSSTMFNSSCLFSGGSLMMWQCITVIDACPLRWFP